MTNIRHSFWEVKWHDQFAQIITHHPWCKLHYPIHVFVFSCPITEHCQVGLSFNRLKDQPGFLWTHFLCLCFIYAPVSKTSLSFLAEEFMIGKSSFHLIRIAIRVVQCFGFNSKICENAKVAPISSSKGFMSFLRIMWKLQKASHVFFGKKKVF